MGASSMLSAIVVGLLVLGQTAGEAAPRRFVRHSIGSPRDGQLVRGVRLVKGPGFYIANQATAWGTPTTIEHLRGAFDKVHAQRPDAEVRVGDISQRGGGPLKLHQSHQSGRDADLGLVPPPGTARLRGRFERVPAERIGVMDERATLELVRALAATTDEPGGVQWILMDYGLQERLHAEGVAAGLDAAELEALFQFPRGRWAEHGVVRHFPRHRNHMHVRFSCEPRDRECRARRSKPPRLRRARGPSTTTTTKPEPGKRLRKSTRPTPKAKDERLPAPRLRRSSKSESEAETEE